MIPLESSHPPTSDGTSLPSAAPSLPPSVHDERRNNPAQGTLPVSQVFAEAIFDMTANAMLILYADLTVHSANQVFYQLFQVDPKETIGKYIYQLGNTQWDIPALRKLLEEILPTEGNFSGYEIAHEFEGIGHCILGINARWLDELQLILLVITDVTQQKQAEQPASESRQLDRFRMQLADALQPLVLATEVQTTAVRMLGEQLQANRVLYAAAGQEEGTWQVTAEYTTGTTHVAGNLAFDAYNKQLRDEAETGRAHIFTDIQPDSYVSPTQKTTANAAQIGAYVLVSSVYDRQTMGLLIAQGIHPRAWTPTDVALVEETAKRIEDALKRIQTADALRQSEQKQHELIHSLETEHSRLLAVLKNLPVGVWIADANGALIEKNLEADRIWLGEAPLLKHMDNYPTYEAWYADNGQKLSPSDYPVAKALLTGTSVAPVELQICRFDGSRGTVLVSAAPIHNSQGQLQGAVGVNVDISERKQAENALRASEMRHAFLVKLGNALRPTHDTRLIKSMASQILGEQLQANCVYYLETDQNATELISPNDYYAAGESAILHQHPTSGYSPWALHELHADRPVVVPDTEHWLEESESERARYTSSQIAAFVNYPLVKEGKLVAVLSVTQSNPRQWTDDELSLIRETAERTWSGLTRARAEAGLRATSERLRLAQEVARVGTYEWDIQKNINHWSPEIERLYGLPTGTFAGSYEAWAKLVHPDDLPEAEKRVQIALNTGHFEAEWRAVKPSGDTVWLMARGWVEKDALGVPLRMIGVNVDITEWKEAEAALRESEERYRTLFNSIDESFAVMEMIYDHDGTPIDYRFLETNPTFERVTGLRNAVGKTALELTPDLEQQWIDIYSEVATTGEPKRFTREAQKEGKWYEAYAFRIGDPSERRVAILFNDVTVRKQAEQRLRDMNESLEQRVVARTAQVRKLITQLTISEQAERRRISQILHDDLQQRIFGLQFQLKIVRDALNTGKITAALAKLDEINDAILTTVYLTRSLSIDLSPPILQNEGLSEALSWLATQLKQQHGLSVEVVREEQVPISDDDLRVLLFQTVRELLFNVIKHAGVAEASVTLGRVDDCIRIEISDRGKGFDVELVWSDSLRSHGIRQNQQRLALMGGSLQIKSSPHSGTQAIIECPILNVR